MKGIKAFVFLLNCILILGVGKKVYAQDPQFSQSFAAPLYINPAFAGVTNQDRFVMNYRNQWSNIAGGFKTYSISYDHNFKKKNTGLGVSLIKDDSGIHGLRFTNFSVAYAHDIKIGRAKGIRTGINLGYAWRRFDPNKLLFWDQILRDNSFKSLESSLGEGASYVDGGFGLIYYAPRLWGGISIQHVNEPKNTLLGYQSRIDIKYSAHLGAQLALTKNRKDQAITSFIPVVLYKRQAQWQQLDIGGYLAKGNYTLGAIYRGMPLDNQEIEGYKNNDSFIVLAGCQVSKRMRVGYSYDITISGIATNTVGSHEVSMIYEWHNPKRQKKSALIPCPRF